MKNMYRILALLACCAAVVGVQVLKHTDSQPHDAVSKPATSIAHSNGRTVYPYSVVPGGVVSAAEVKAAKDGDATVGAHYAGINVAKLMPVKQTGDVKRYVSYRMNGEIYWTSKPVTVKNGELLLTDGSTTIRARCGNLLSDKPQNPKQASGNEPSEEDLDNPIPLAYTPGPRYVDSPGTLVPAVNRSASDPTIVYPWGPASDEFSSADGFPTVPVITQPAASISMPPVKSAPASSGSPSASSVPGGYIPPALMTLPKETTTQVAATPEPSTIVLIGLGLAGLVLLKRRAL